MAVDLIPGGALLGTLTVQPAVLLLMKVWIPHDPPKPIGPGELDAVTTATNRIYWEWHEGPNWQALAGDIIGTGYQVLVSEQFQVSEYRHLETGWGQTLDEIGASVGLARNGLPQELYRQAIAVRGASMVSNAGIDSVMRPIKSLLGAGNVVYLPTYPAAFCWVILIALPPEVLDLLLELLAPLAGSGIGMKLALAPPESPGWDWAVAQTWAGSWSSAYGAVDASVASTWGWAISVG